MNVFNIYQNLFYGHDLSSNMNFINIEKAHFSYSTFACY